MSDELLAFYNRELSFLRRLGAEFAQAHPKIAQRLRLGADASEDPHVERFIQATALLNARTRLKLEDDFPELTDALLGVLYPHYQLPIPSMAVVQMELDASQAPPTEGHVVPRLTAVETEPIDGEPCRFRTGYPVTLWPLDVRTAKLQKPPFTAPATPYTGQAAALLKLTLSIRGEQPVRIGELSLERLRFYLKGQHQHVFPLYQLLFKHTMGVALAAFAEDPEPLVLGPECVRPVGFERDEGLMPYPARSFVGYRLLTEFFAFPEKFVFFELSGWHRGDLAWLTDRMEIYFFLDRVAPELEQNVTADTFRLGCTPVVNLYPLRAEPIELTQTENEHRIIPDARRPLAHEVYSIRQVTAQSPDGVDSEFEPFFSVKHADAGRQTTRYWQATRRRAVGTEERPDFGSEVFLSLVDLGFRTNDPGEGTLTVETICLNRDLPHRLPFSDLQPRLTFTEPDVLVGRLRCLTPPTPTLRPALKLGAMWRLISHLSLNHLSLEGGREGAEALREILKLYDFADSEETRTMIAGVLNVNSRRVVARTGGEGGDAVCRGVEVDIRFDDKCFAGSGLYLFASVLERFVALYATINSFTRMVASVEGRKGDLWRWPPRMGEKVLL